VSAVCWYLLYTLMHSHILQCADVYHCCVMYMYCQLCMFLYWLCVVYVPSVL
jgi:hypothetical protein